MNNRCSFNNWSRTASKSNNTQSESVKYLIQSFVISATLRPSHRRSIIETGDGTRRHRTASSSYQATAACHHDSSANTTRAYRSWGLGLWVLNPWIYVGGVRVCPDPLIASHSFIQNCCWNTASFTSSRIKDVSIMEGKIIFFRGAYRLTRTGIVECLEIVDEGCNLKQFDSLTWLTLTSIFYDRSTSLNTKSSLMFMTDEWGDDLFLKLQIRQDT